MSAYFLSFWGGFSHVGNHNPESDLQRLDERESSDGGDDEITRLASGRNMAFLPLASSGEVLALLIPSCDVLLRPFVWLFVDGAAAITNVFPARRRPSLPPFALQSSAKGRFSLYN